jgi:hypothetical protein
MALLPWLSRLAGTGKLFEYDSGASQWRERGAGELRVNVSPSGHSSRMLMRQVGVQGCCGKQGRAQHSTEHDPAAVGGRSISPLS